MMAAPGPSSRRRPRMPRWAWVALPIAIAVAALELFAVFALSPTGLVVVRDAAFQYTTPPSEICPYSETSAEPPTVLEVRPGALFNLSWDVGCEPYGPGNTTGAEFAITSISSVNWPFQVVSSNVPAVFGYAKSGWFNVTVRAPALPYNEQLVLTVLAGPWSGP